MHLLARGVLPFVLAAFASAQGDPDRDKDGLSDFQELHKYRTDPTRADSDGDGVPDGDRKERREYEYTLRIVVRVMRPVTIEHLCDDHQDARVLDETAEYVELEVVHYPFTTVAAAVQGDPKWRTTVRAMQPWSKPGPTADWTPALRDRIDAALREQGVDVARLDDRTLVERAAHMLCERATPTETFTTFVTAFDPKGRPFVPKELAAKFPADAGERAALWAHDLSAAGMFEHRERGSCTSTAIYLTGCLRALGIPTRIVLCIPLIDANDRDELQLVERGITHHGLRRIVQKAAARLVGKWASHTFNEVFVGGRWRRLNDTRLGQDSLDPGGLGLMTHVATFADWADARMPETIGRRQALERYDDAFGGRNPYSTTAVDDAFGPHCGLENPERSPGRITALRWGDDPALEQEFRDWFRNRGVFGLLARVELPADVDGVQQLLAASDLALELTADGAPSLRVGLHPGAWWGKGDHAWVFVPFGAGERETLATGRAYRVTPRNRDGTARWQVADGVLVAARATK